MTSTPPGPGISNRTPQVVFACVRNGGRSVISRVLTEHYAAGAVTALSAGTQPGDQIHSEVADVLQKLGLDRMAERAQAMTHVLAPRPGGFIAALDAAPEADVVLVAHTGLDHVLTVGDIWRELPMDKRITMRWWKIARAEIPDDRSVGRSVAIGTPVAMSAPKSRAGRAANDLARTLTGVPRPADRISLLRKRPSNGSPQVRPVLSAAPQANAQPSCHPKPTPCTKSSAS